MIDYGDSDTVHAGGGGDVMSATVTSTTKKRPSQQDVRDYFKEMGYSDAGASGIARRAVVESDLNPDAVGDGGTSFGLFQHHKERADALARFAEENGLSADDWKTQAKFADYEMRENLPALHKTLSTTDNADLAYNQFTDVFERPKKGGGSGLGQGSVRFSDFALTEPADDKNTDLVSMSPKDYLSMSPPLESPWTDKSGKSLLSSLKSGDAIEQAPSLKVNRDGEVEDQDGRHRALAAQDAGMESIPVAIQKPAGITLPEQIKGMQGTTMSTPQVAPTSAWRDWLIPRAEAAENKSGSVPVQNVGGTVPGQTGNIGQEHIAGRQASINFGSEDKPVEFGQQDQELKPMSTAETLGSALMDVPRRANQLIANIPDPLGFIPGPQQQVAQQGTNAINDAMAQREQEIEARGGNTWLRTLGNMPAAVAIGAIPGVGPGMAGAAMGALTPTDNNSLKDFAWNTALGYLGGKTAATAGNALRRGIAPALDAARNLLAREGVNMTPGQLAGGVMQRAENALSRMGILGHLTRQAELRSIQDFNNAALNRALGQIGERLPPGVPAGRPAIGIAQQQVSDAYDGLLRNAVFRADQRMADDLTDLRDLVNEMPPAQRSQFANIVQNRLMQRLQPTGTMDGQTFKQVESELGFLSRPYRASQDQAFQQLGSAIEEVRAIIRDTLERANPDVSAGLQAINRAYAILSRVEDASMRRATADGVFTPADLLRTLAQNARRTGGKKAFARGDAMMQDLASAAQEVLPDKIPGTSPTAELLNWHSLLGMGAAYMRPETLIPAAALQLPYTRPGIAAVNALARPAGPTRNAIAQIPAALGQYGAAPAGIAAANVGEELRR